MSIGPFVHLLPSLVGFVPRFSGMRLGVLLAGGPTRFHALVLAVLLAGAASSGCSEEPSVSPERLVVPDACDGRDAGLVCKEGVALTCGAGDIVSQDDCEAQSLTCSPLRG